MTCQNRFLGVGTRVCGVMACWIHGSIERGGLEESEDCRFRLSELADLQKKLAARGLPRDLYSLWPL